MKILKKVSRREKRLAALQLLWKRGTLHEKDAAEAHAILKYLNKKELEWGAAVGGEEGGGLCMKEKYDNKSQKHHKFNNLCSVLNSYICARK